MHFWNSRLLRWPRFFVRNSFPLSCRAQILTKRSLMAFLLFKNQPIYHQSEQPSSSTLSNLIEEVGMLWRIFIFLPCHPHISQKGSSLETQFRQEATCLEYLRQATGKDRQIQFCIFLHSLSEKVWASTTHSATIRGKNTSYIDRAFLLLVDLINGFTILVGLINGFTMAMRLQGCDC